MNLSELSLERDLGILPVSLFAYRSKLIKFLSLPNSFGISPPRLFLYSSLQMKFQFSKSHAVLFCWNNRKKERRTQDKERGTYRYWRLTRRLISGPMEPETLELPKSL
jgi:hypothetical protein